MTGAEFLASNLSPCKIKHVSCAFEKFTEYLKKSDEIWIASGYISEDSVLDFLRFLELNERKKVRFLIGMHYYDKFTNKQYAAVKKLHDYLIQSESGSVRLSIRKRFHGKVYGFFKNGVIQKAIIGSSNFSSICTTSPTLYELDVAISEKLFLNRFQESLEQLYDELSEELHRINISNYKGSKAPIEENTELVKLSADELDTEWQRATNNKFIIPLKSEPKSNLNVYFGKGRKDKKGFIKPRPWYEVEIIVPKSITSHATYPKNKTFGVITDDGWRFKCKTNGDHAKNLRSSGDLTTLGKWIKGKLQQSGALIPGEPVTESVLSRYGRDHIELIATEDPSQWLLNFSARR